MALVGKYQGESLHLVPCAMKVGKDFGPLKER